MSIMLDVAQRVISAPGDSDSDDLSSAVRALLDHVAVELAAEYVRLMESAAANEAGHMRTNCETGEEHE
jgi:hypothetical protein